ncbi:MAG: AraC family transcriptional regulator [Cyanothece sp. SIO1E1]|nr:AraC family transcriptional regulator [Cyanothece sp. SIO1E1]
MDVLSDVFRTLRVESCIFAKTRLRTPWGLKQPQSEAAAFHYIVQGHCLLQVEESNVLRATSPHPFIAIERGDFLLFPHGHGHILADAPSSQLLDVDEVFAGKSAAEAEQMMVGGSGAETLIICGCFRFTKRPTHPLLASLPALVRMNIWEAQAGDWIDSTLQLAATEIISPGPGSEEIIIRLLDILFIQVLRHQMQHLPPGHQNWLSSLQDTQIAAAIQCIHAAPENAWSVDSLAKAVGMSRSAFAARFSALVGEPPMQYLSKWRIQKAEALLRTQAMPLHQVAATIGYHSDQVFNRVFKRYMGVTPGAYRKAHTKRVLHPVSS